METSWMRGMHAVTGSGQRDDLGSETRCGHQRARWGKLRTVSRKVSAAGELSGTNLESDTDPMRTLQCTCIMPWGTGIR